MQVSMQENCVHSLYTRTFLQRYKSNQYGITSSCHAEKCDYHYRRKLSIRYTKENIYKINHKYQVPKVINARRHGMSRKDKKLNP